MAERSHDKRRMILGVGMIMVGLSLTGRYFYPAHAELFRSVAYCGTLAAIVGASAIMGRRQGSA